MPGPGEPDSQLKSTCASVRVMTRVCRLVPEKYSPVRPGPGCPSRVVRSAEPGTIVSMFVRQALVPTLVEGGHHLAQSMAIIEYLEETHPEPPLLPVGAVRVGEPGEPSSWLDEAGRRDPLEIGVPLAP